MNKLSLFTSAAVLASPASLIAQTDLGPLNLPTTTTSLPLLEDFEAAAGVVPPYMALTNLDVASLSVDPEAWCNIGNVATPILPFRGSYCLEMGLEPNSTNYHDVRNAMVLYVDPAGYTGAMSISAQIIDGGEEADPVDGIWLSSDGTNWYSVLTNWGTSIIPDNEWTATGEIALTNTPVNTNQPFYIAFCQEDNFPYLDLDGIGVDEIKIPGDPFSVDLGPISLPQGSTVGLPWQEGFEFFQGQVPPYMVANSLDVNTLTVDPEGFCNVGQLAACIDPFSGAQNLEMGLIQGAATHEGRQVLVIAFDGSTYSGEKTISWVGKNYGEEADQTDGVWISDNGLNWFEIQSGWSTPVGEWKYSGVRSYEKNGVNTDGIFYIAFSQQEDSPFSTGSDGYAIDEISIPAAPFLEVDQLRAGLFSTFRVQSGYSNRLCKFLASRVGGGPTTVQGVTLSLTPPILQLADVPTDGNGNAIYSMIIPTAALGQQVWLQSVIVSIGEAVVSNSVSGTIL